MEQQVCVARILLTITNYIGLNYNCVLRSDDHARAGQNARLDLGDDSYADRTGRADGAGDRRAY